MPKYTVHVCGSFTLVFFSCIWLLEFSPVMLQLFPYGHIWLAFRKLVVHLLMPPASSVQVLHISLRLNYLYGYSAWRRMDGIIMICNKWFPAIQMLPSLSRSSVVIISVLVVLRLLTKHRRWWWFCHWTCAAQFLGVSKLLWLLYVVLWGFLQKLWAMASANYYILDPIIW